MLFGVARGRVEHCFGNDCLYRRKHHLFFSKKHLKNDEIAVESTLDEFTQLLIRNKLNKLLKT